MVVAEDRRVVTRIAGEKGRQNRAARRRREVAPFDLESGRIEQVGGALVGKGIRRVELAPFDEHRRVGLLQQLAAR